MSEPLEELELKRVKAVQYYEQIDRAIKAAYEEAFKGLAEGQEPDFHLINKASLAVFAKFAGVMAVDEQMTEEMMMRIMSAAYKDAYTAAPKFS